MLFQTGSRRISKCTAPGELSLRAGVLDRRIDAAELREILAEHRREFFRLGIVGRCIRPGSARIEHAGRNALYFGWNRQAEEWIQLGPDIVDIAGERSVHHRPGICELDPLSGAVRTSAPPGID